MQIVTTQILFDKYPGHEQELKNLLYKFTPNVTILPINDYVLIKQTCDKINDSILLVGNDDVVQFAQVNNPATDSDAVVWSDAPYACIKDRTYLVPDKIISRIPDEGNAEASWDYISNVLNNQLAWSKIKTNNSGWFNLVAAVWSSIGQYMHDRFKMDGQNNISPPVTYHNLVTLDTTKKMAYINLHSAMNSENYFNQIGTTFDVALTPQQGNFNGCLAMIEACYGGFFLGKSKEKSIALMALYSNCIALVASSTIAYGPAAPPAMAADLLTQCFYDRVLAGEPVGLAFKNAKVDYSTITFKQQGSMVGAARKTLLSFNLFGNPDLVI